MLCQTYSVVMNSSQEMNGRVDFVDSMNIVTLDLERGHSQGTYDSIRDSPSMAVVAVVATVLGKDPQVFAPSPFCYRYRCPGQTGNRVGYRPTGLQPHYILL